MEGGGERRRNMEGKRKNKGVRGMWNGEKVRKGSKKAERGNGKRNGDVEKTSIHRVECFITRQKSHT